MYTSLSLSLSNSIYLFYAYRFPFHAQEVRLQQLITAQFALSSDHRDVNEQ
jgi:hypothetical protein